MTTETSATAAAEPEAPAAPEPKAPDPATVEPLGDDWSTIRERLKASYASCRPMFAPLRLDRLTREFAEPREGDWMPCTQTALATLIWAWHGEAAHRIYEGTREPGGWLSGPELPEAAPVAILTLEPLPEPPAPTAPTAAPAVTARRSRWLRRRPEREAAAAEDAERAPEDIRHLPATGRHARSGEMPPSAPQQRPTPPTDDADDAEAARIQQQAREAFKRAHVTDQDFADLDAPRDHDTAVLEMPLDGEQQ